MIMKDISQSGISFPVANILKDQTFVRVLCHELYAIRVYFKQQFSGQQISLGLRT
jgi:hypothetical protein